MKLQTLVNEHYDELNLNDLHIWRYINNHPEKCSRMSITELAQCCNVSRTSILRFTQKISLEGYSELKYYLRNEMLENDHLSDHIISDICNDYVKAIDYANSQNMKEACELIYHAKRIFAFGSGEIQQLAVTNLRRLFFKADKMVHPVNGESEMIRMLANAQENDLIFLISYGGESKRIVDFAKKCREKHCQIISLTYLRENSLSRLADVPLFFLTSYFNLPIRNLKFAPIGMFFIVTEILFLQYSLYVKEVEPL